MKLLHAVDVGMVMYLKRLEAGRFKDARINLEKEFPASII